MKRLRLPAELRAQGEFRSQWRRRTRSSRLCRRPVRQDGDVDDQDDDDVDEDDNDADDDEDGGPHPDPNHCLDGQHLGVPQGYDGGGEDEETNSTAGVNIKDS